MYMLLEYSGPTNGTLYIIAHMGLSTSASLWGLLPSLRLNDALWVETLLMGVGEWGTVKV